MQKNIAVICDNYLQFKIFVKEKRRKLKSLGKYWNIGYHYYNGRISLVTHDMFCDKKITDTYIPIIKSDDIQGSDIFQDYVMLNLDYDLECEVTRRIRN